MFLSSGKQIILTFTRDFANVIDMLLNVLNPLQVFDFKEHATTEIPIRANESPFKDFDVKKKDVEKATKL